MCIIVSRWAELVLQPRYALGHLHVVLATAILPWVLLYGYLPNLL